ncbi:MAG: 3-hydroxyacyl-CoA dehydrogenase family protein [Chloroflexi bacterium]|nr:3-hydroxyacyl-CoA dehydrogenase family protein [Chloroflexota bacterium]
MSTDNVAVIGGGLMGHGIAQVAAMSGQEVTLIDVSEAALTKARQKMADSLGRLAEKGRLQGRPEDVLGRISTTTNLADGVHNVDCVIEAVFEDINLKQLILGEVDAHAPGHAILATNTSGLSITVIAEVTRRQENVIGMHWMNPPQLMRLVELVRGKHTSDETLQATLGLCHKYGKETVIAERDVWFFLAARARMGWTLECALMYLRGEAGVREIDAAGKHKVGLPMGEFELADFLGAVDIRTDGLKSAEQILKGHPDFEPWPGLLEAYRQVVAGLWGPMKEKGLSGIKTGKGFYDYPGGKYIKPEIPRELAEKVHPLQLLAPGLNSAAWCVSNGVGSIADINKALRLAYGWPKGIFEFLGEYDIKDVLATLKAKEAKSTGLLREFYRPDPLLVNWKT